MDVSPGQTWYYKVRAYNSAGESPLSTYASATALGVEDTPDYTKLSAGSPSYGSLSAGQTLYYYFEITGPDYYTVSWDDRDTLGGDSGYADIKVGLKYWDATSYVLPVIDRPCGTNAVSIFYNNTGYIIVEVQGYDSSSSGQFGVTYTTGSGCCAQTGARKDSDWWIKQRIEEKGKEPETRYRAMVLYTIPKTILNEQIAQQLRQLASGNPELDEAFNSITTQILENGLDSARIPAEAPAVSQYGSNFCLILLWRWKQRLFVAAS
jgi:hypothetical protein